MEHGDWVSEFAAWTFGATGVSAADVTPEMILEWVAGIADVMMQGTET